MVISHNPTVTIEVRYLSQSYTHLQVEYTTEFNELEEGWIHIDTIHNEFNIFDDIMELEVEVSELDKEGIFHD